MHCRRKNALPVTEAYHLSGRVLLLDAQGCAVELRQGTAALTLGWRLQQAVDNLSSHLPLLRLRPHERRPRLRDAHSDQVVLFLVIHQTVDVLQFPRALQHQPLPEPK